MSLLTISMKIEAIEQTRSPQGKLRVRFDNGKTLMMFPSAVAELCLSAGMEIPDSAMESIEEVCGQASAKERAVRMISASAVSKRGLRRKLIQKGESEEHADAAVQWLDEMHLLNDAQVAEQIVRSGMARGYGAARIKQMLYEKQIPKQYWDEALSQITGQEDAIDAFLQKRFRGTNPDQKEIKRTVDALLRRGHTWSDIRAALARYAPDAELIED